MKMERLAVVLTGLNAVLLLGLLVHAWPATADTPPGMLRGSGLQIVDSAGNVRASIGIIPASTTASGEMYPETVLLRLIDANGQPSTKISTSTDGAGLSFVVATIRATSSLRQRARRRPSRWWSRRDANSC